MRLGVLVTVLALVAAPAYGGPPVTSRDNDAATQDHGRTNDLAKGEPKGLAPSPAVVVQVEPGAQEVEAVANQEAAKRRVLGLEPDAWVALFTAVLSASTIFLWWDTRKSANAALRAAVVAERALTEAERPYLVASIPTSGVKHEKMGYSFGFGAGTFTNHGRTPAILMHVYTKWELALGAPKPLFEPEARGGSHIPNEVIATGKTCPEIPFRPYLPNPPPTLQEMEYGTLWLLGYVRYKDMLNSEYITVFTFTLTDEDEFELSHPAGEADKYNYTHKIEKPEPKRRWFKLKLG